MWTGKPGLAGLSKQIDKLPQVKDRQVERCKQQLLKVWNTDQFSDEAMLAHALDRQQKEARWQWLYVPGLPFAALILAFVIGGFLISGLWHQLTSFAVAVSILICFKLQFYDAYLEKCTNLVRAAIELKSASSVPTAPSISEASLEPTAPPEQVPSLTEPTTNLTERLAANPEPPPIPEELTSLPTEMASKTGPVLEWTYYGDELKSFFAQPGNGSPKGRIPLLLLDQRIRKECGMPSLYEKSPANMEFSVRVVDCKPKNLKDKYHYYGSKQMLAPKTAGARTTHLKYLVMLEQHYEELGEISLANKAREFHKIIHSIKISKKTRNMQKMNPPSN